MEMQKRIIRQKQERIQKEKEKEEIVNKQIMKCIKEDLAL